MKESKETYDHSYRGLLNRVKNIIINPKVEWSNIIHENLSINDILTSFTLPIVGFLSVITFMGCLFDFTNFSLEIALKKSTIVFIKHFGGLYLSYYIIKKLKSFLQLNKDDQILFALFAYSSIILYIIELAIIISPELFLFKILSAYIVYIVWNFFIDIKQESQSSRLLLNTIIISLVTIVLPEFISHIIFQLVKI